MHPVVHAERAYVEALLDQDPDGLETCRSGRAPDCADPLRAIAARRGVLESGGSDTRWLGGVRQPGDQRIERERIAPRLGRIDRLVG